MDLRELVLTSMLLAACGDEPYEGLLEPPPADEGVQFGLKVTVDPGAEVTVCKNFAMPEGAFDVARFESAMTPISHHLLVYNLSLAPSAITNELIMNCGENRDAQAPRIGFLWGSQSERSDLPLPEGIAFPTRGGLSIQLEYHVLNASEQPIDAEAALNLWRAKGTITGEAGMLFVYNTRIAIPPMTKTTARMRWPIADDVDVMMLVPHMHSRGVAMQAFRDNGDGSPDELYSVQGWENPNQMFTPAVHFAANDVLDFHCDFENTTSNWIFDGFSARYDEMCVTGGVYYRPGADRLPIQDEVDFGRGIVYSGTNSCSQIEACATAIDWSNWSATPLPPNQLDLCVLAGCQAGGDAFTNLNQCRYGTCQSSCYTLDANGRIIGLKFSDAACASCIDTSCAGARDACTAAACP